MTADTPPYPFTFSLGSSTPVSQTKGGEVRIADSSTFKVSTTVGRGARDNASRGLSTPTALAVRVAAAWITLVAIARGCDFEIFSHPGRIAEAASGGQGDAA